jgi:tRNA-splicing ligase RtcB
MKKSFHEEGSFPLHLWTDNVEESAIQQLRNMARLPFIHPHGVVAMPDVHFGIGATVGSVIATSKAIIPAAVGVDVGCGMAAIRLSLKASDLPDSLKEIRHSIERGVPLGTGGRFQTERDMGDLETRWSSIEQKHPLLSKNKRAYQLGTLGSGNHFIEICLDENQDVWVMLHSGSRGVGNLVGRYFISRAKKLMEDMFIKLPDADLAYFGEGTQDFNDYVEAVRWAQDYALANRATMLLEILRSLPYHIKKPFLVTSEAIYCHHNYVEQENHFGRNVWLTRKGAIRARLGDMGIIPSNMGQKSYIVSGLGNVDSYNSCSHGAGRVMGRKEARRRFTVEDLVNQTQGVECRKDDAVLDEIPSSYKDIDAVMEDQKDLVKIEHTLKQVLCVKGG